MADFMDYFDRMHAAMQARFDAMNREFERAMAAPAAEGTTTYSKTVSRSYSGPGNCGEETIVERDSAKGKEVRTHTRRIGDRSIQQVESKDLKTGQVEKSALRKALQESDDAAFDEEWAKMEKQYLPPARHLLHGSHDHGHHHSQPQLQDKPAGH